ncbi:MAG: penicillin-binding protein activator LpoB [Deltaproteobacteria bacterium]|nr:penicillin-binding protein activator LpoB [Deltaproteobacteria bacterium]MBT8358873.1 penicillin-binding protein activator LpoB [Deltaproteobacteria bacterium]MBT8373790.1 penicillin-binding protein activator LpoB [Deltaproteobacteria bacterium]NNK85034.1 penicillin-binding protein activator LpoB [Desulfobacterales bacterium]NNL43450.1 penicillin-binding protein activator LpoB [Desulfobacterales bacterium]
MKLHTVAIIIFITIALLVSGCASGPVVERKAVDSTIDLSGRWNDADSRMVSEEMIKDCLSRPWLQRFKIKHGGEPTVIVGRVKNRSHEHINVQTFVKDLERALINSGQVQFVASKGERAGIREERKDMAKHSSDETMKGPGQETGADFMLIGVINTIRDDIGKKAVMYYQTNLELINLASNVKVWIGDKKIKKLIKKKSVKW